MNVSFGKMMRSTAVKYRDKEALVNVERNRRLTFMELHLLTNRICNAMRDRFGLKEGDVFATLLNNDNSSLFSLWMCKGAATGFWMDFLDSLEKHIKQLEFVKPKLLFMESNQLGKYYKATHALGIDIVCLDMDPCSVTFEGVISFDEFLRGASDAETSVEYDYDEHVAVLRFTGGTTGEGKCAPYSLRTIFEGMKLFYESPECYFGESVRHLHVTPVTHGAVFTVFPVFFKGGTMLTINSPRLEEICRVIPKEQITSIFVVPTILYRMVDLIHKYEYDFSSLKTVFYGAAPMSPERLRELQAIFGNNFVQAYGATEAFPPLTLLGKQDHNLSNSVSTRRLASAGHSLPGVEIKIVDNDGVEIPVGELGEIWIRGLSVIRGYYNSPEKTSHEFTRDGYWKSGDIGYLDEDDYLYIVDRKKDMIITGGFNVYSAEVENVINTHPDVQQCAVVGIPHADWGESVHAEVVLKQGHESVSTDEIIALCKERLGKYKTPKSITVVDNLPTSAVGKILRREVRAKYWQKLKRKVN